MPSLILSSRYTTDSQLLRQTAQRLGWETVRVDGAKIPDWFEPADDQVALFYTAPHAFDIARELSRTLLGCHGAWAIELPAEFLLRELRQTTLAEALRLPGKSFVKHAVAKAFPAAVYDAKSLAAATADLAEGALVHMGEPVKWQVEYRCFVVDRQIAAISPYRRHGVAIEDHSNLLGADDEEFADARACADRVLKSSAVACPAAFVLDVGIIEGRGWAVVECNECWASGIYACDPAAVLTALVRACVPNRKLTTDDKPWDFQRHYWAAAGS